MQFRPDLDPNLLENRIMTDIFMYCFSRITRSDVLPAIKANSQADLERFEGYIQFEKEKYQKKEVDLTISREESELKEAIFKGGRKIRAADMESTLEALKFASKYREKQGL